MVRVVGFWVVAPFVPPALAVALATLPISIGWQETIVNSVVGAMTIAALALSIWGATVIKVWLKTLPVSGSAVFGLPLIAVTFIATAQHVARTLPMGPENGMTHHATQTVSTFLGVWTVLVAYQGKFFWDRAVEAWEKDGLRSLVPGLKRFNPLSKHLARTRLAHRQARAWRALRAAGSFDDIQRREFKHWRRIRRNRRALEAQGDLRDLLIKFGICLAALVLMWLLLRLRRS